MNRLRRLRRLARNALVCVGVLAPRVVPEPTADAIRNMRHLIMRSGIGPLAAMAYEAADPDEYALVLTRLVTELERFGYVEQARQVLELLRGDWR